MHPTRNIQKGLTTSRFGSAPSAFVESARHAILRARDPSSELLETLNAWDAWQSAQVEFELVEMKLLLRLGRKDVSGGTAESSVQSAKAKQELLARISALEAANKQLKVHFAPFLGFRRLQSYATPFIALFIGSILLEELSGTLIVVQPWSTIGAGVAIGAWILGWALGHCARRWVMR